MMLQSMEVPCGKKCQTLQKTTKILILVGIATALFTVIPLYHPLLGYTLKNHPNPPSPSSSSIEEAIHHDDETIVISTNDKCDIFTGEWVPNPHAPYYTNASCWAIYEHLNCAKYGRPDTEFLKWRWRPAGCEMGVFNPFQFLDIVRNKTMIFVGDSVARNQFQSMICLLSPLQSMEVPSGKKCQTLQKTPKILILVGIATALFTVIPLYHPLLGYTLKNHPNPPSPSSSSIEEAIHHDDETIVISTNDKCDIFTGEWVPNPHAPYYTNASCWAIYEHLNCAKYGRPDTEFLKWRWRPDGCEMGVFNPFQFLDIVRNKTMVFVGDSVARNQLQSMICLLSPAEWPVDVSYTTDELFMRWKYMSYNFTMAFYTTPFLVKIEEDPNNPSGLYNLYLDEYDERWTNDIGSSDYVIISAGHSFFRPGMYYENRKLVGCRYCQIENVVDLPMYYGYRRAFRTAFRAINNMEKFKGITFLRTFSPSHFEGGLWDTGGDCARKRPWSSNEAHLGGVDLELYMTQVEEFRAAEREGKKKGKRFRLLDTTQAMYMRPDGHPSRYGHLNKENETVYNDCVNWCLPGPIDTWADFLLDMLKKEGKRSHEELLLFQRQNKARI